MGRRLVRLLLLGAFVGFVLPWVVPGTARLAGSFACPARGARLVVVAEPDLLLQLEPLWWRAYCVGQTGAPVPVPYPRIGGVLMAQVVVLGVALLLLIAVLRGLPARRRAEVFVPPDPAALSDPNRSPFQ